ncbi:MAG: hypothetical protein ACYCX4_09375 [Bacillota bacterium]
MEFQPYLGRNSFFVLRAQLSTHYLAGKIPESEKVTLLRKAGQHNLLERRTSALFKLFKEVRDSACQKANNAKRKSSTTPREAKSCSQGKQEMQINKNNEHQKEFPLVFRLKEWHYQ